MQDINLKTSLSNAVKHCKPYYTREDVHLMDDPRYMHIHKVNDVDRFSFEELECGLYKCKICGKLIDQKEFLDNACSYIKDIIDQATIQRIKNQILCAKMGLASLNDFGI